MVFRRSQIAKIAHRLGITRLIASLAKTPGLLVLCYHRIGHGEKATYDPDVYSATSDEFDDQVAYLKQTYGITTLEEVLDGFSRGSWDQTKVLLTFDDGYLDNYTTAYPILRSHGVQATFLLPTSFVGTAKIPWWDAICYMIAKSPERLIRVPSLTPEVFDKALEGPVSVMRRVLRLYRDTHDPDPGRVIREVEASSMIDCPAMAAQRRFLNWEEAREMLRGGMAIGSHSHSHSLFGGMPFAQQREEALLSRSCIAARLGITPRVFALPCGSYSDQSAAAVREAGYELSLSVDPGVNRAGSWEPYRIRRVLVNRDDLKESSRLRLALLTSGGKLESLAGIG